MPCLKAEDMPCWGRCHVVTLIPPIEYYVYHLLLWKRVSDGLAHVHCSRISMMSLACSGLNTLFFILGNNASCMFLCSVSVIVPSGSKCQHTLWAGVWLVVSNNMLRAVSNNVLCDGTGSFRICLCFVLTLVVTTWLRIPCNSEHMIFLFWVFSLMIKVCYVGLGSLAGSVGLYFVWTLYVLLTCV